MQSDALRAITPSISFREWEGGEKRGGGVEYLCEMLPGFAAVVPGSFANICFVSFGHSLNSKNTRRIGTYFTKTTAIRVKRTKTNEIMRNRIYFAIKIRRLSKIPRGCAG